MAIGWYIKDAKRDGVPTRIEVEVVEGVLYLHVEGAQRKRKVTIEMDVKDLVGVLASESGRLLHPELLPSAPVQLSNSGDMDPQDAAQILGPVPIEDDFTPKS